MQINLNRGLRIYKDKSMTEPIDDGLDFGDIPAGDTITYTVYLGNNSDVTVKNIKHEINGHYKITSHPTSLKPYQAEPVTIKLNSKGLFYLKKIESLAEFTGEVEYAV